MTDSATQVAVLVAPAAGVPVLRDVFRSLQGDFPGAIVILLHAGNGHERKIADNLNVASNFMVLPGLDGVALRDGHAYVVEAGANLMIDGDGRLTRAYGPVADDDSLLLDDRLSSTQSEALLSSLAVRYGPGAIAVALTALDADESEGFRRVRAAGGHTIALDESDRLWADARGARVVPDPADELLTTASLGPRMIAMLAPILAA